MQEKQTGLNFKSCCTAQHPFHKEAIVLHEKLTWQPYLTP